MASVNKVIIVGNLGAARKPNICRAVTPRPTFASRRPTREGQDEREKKEATEWHRIAFFAVSPKSPASTEKGSQVYVEGQLRTRKWQDKDGQTV